MATPFLEARAVSKSYGGIKALSDVEFACYKGEVHALLGENGAGKSTLVKVLSGVVKADQGVIMYKGKKISIESPLEANQNGIASVFQELSIIPDLTVAENIWLGNEPRTKTGLIDIKETNRKSRELIGELGFQIDEKALVGDLPIAQQQLVEIGKAMSKDPEVLILDEATSALGLKETELLFSLVKRICKKGKAVIFISHRMNEIAEIADRATIFRDARYIRSFAWGEASQREIVEWIAGRKVDQGYAKRESALSKEIILKIEDLSGENLENINLEVYRGEILGISGLQGQGQTNLLHSLFGNQKIKQGSIVVNGSVLKGHTPRVAIKNGLVLVPENRKTEGLLLFRSIRENLALMTLDSRKRMGLVDRKAEKADLERVSQMLKIKAPSMESIVNSLSGGNQQKIVIGKAILTNASVLMLSDPTRGIDVGTKAEIYQMIRNLSNQGVTVLFYSTELEELINLCDRVAVFYQGQIVKVLKNGEIEERALVAAALGLDTEGGKP